jgi:hypothetical protein
VATRFILPGVTQLKPLQQGNLSSMCGLYSVLNCIQLALYPERLSKPELQCIYRHAIEHLSRRRQLKRVLGTGIEHELWTDLRDQLITSANDAYHTALKATATLTGKGTSDRRRAIAQIQKALRSGTPVMASFGGTLDHYSVFCGYTDQRLMLFDSSGLCWIGADNVGLGEHSPRRHWIVADCTSSIVDDW